MPGPHLARADEPGLAWRTQALAQDAVVGWPLVARHNGTGAVVWLAAREGQTSGGLDVRASILENGQWSKPITIEGTGTNVFAVPAARDGHLAIAWLHAEEEAHPASVGEAKRWSLRMWVDGRVYTEVDPLVHRGPVCIRVLSAIQCPPGSGAMGDLMGLDLLPDGRPVVAYASDAGTGLHEGWSALRIAFGQRLAASRLSL